MTLNRLRRERRSAVALLYAIMAVPIIGLVGLAVDYGFWNQTYASMSLAASGAALNAVKISAAATLANDPAAVIEGITAGKQWFMAQLGTATNAPHLNVGPPTVTITTGVTTTATVMYQGNVPSIFGKMFAMAQYPIKVQAVAQVTSAPYLNVEILLDNSPSMEIGATPGDITDLQYLTPCASAYGGTVTYAENLTTKVYSYNTNAAQQSYNAYACTDVGTYDGQNYGEEVCQIPTNSKIAPFLPLTPSGNTQGPSCSGKATPTNPTNAQLVALSPFAGAPCAFACHFDTSKAAGTGADYYALARSTIGKATLCSTAGSVAGSCQITLRFDLVKQAVNQVINTMNTDNLAIDNLNVGIFTFDASLHQVYPLPTTCGTPGSLACQAGGDWAEALNLVGQPPTLPNTPDTGILPYGGGNNPSTDIPDTMTSLATTYLTAAGNGSAATSPLKVLFLVTDGLADYDTTPGNNNTRIYPAIDPGLCTTFKNMGYTVYVVYTPYYPLMNGFYLSSNMQTVEGTGSGTLLTNLQACSSDPNNDFIEANPTDSNSIATALQTFLQRALTSPARFTQ